MDLIDESMNDKALNDLLKLVDVDKDGRINYEGIIHFLHLTGRVG
jgi:Ca2+-binding EF-hand superfamily protein